MNKFVLIGLMLSIIFVTLSVGRPLEDETKVIENKTDENITPDSKLVETVETEKEPRKSDAKPKKSQRNFPQTYYVSTKVNGRFGKSVRAFTSDEFDEQYPQTF